MFIMLTELMLFFLSPLSIGDIQTNADVILKNSHTVISNYRKPQTFFDINNILTYDVYNDISYQRYVGNGVCLNNVEYYPKDMNKIEKSIGIKIAPSCWDCLLRDEALLKFNQLAKDFNTTFKKTFTINSAFRSYESQVKVKQNSAKNKASEPGSSEHQLWLAIDIAVSHFTQEEKEWFNNNIHFYWFTLSYQKGLDIDWYSAEDWHIRYVWNNLAKELYQNKKTFSEWLNYNYKEETKYLCKKDNSAHNKEYFKRKKIEQFKKLLFTK